ncbi:MAG TPA: kelch repeat-containing protein, partial [Planctomycetota bacterium]|nr:kelch repeat-containing protein [Planctomycetota bacterium]
MRTILTLTVLAVLGGAVCAAEPAGAPNQWTKVSDGDLGPGFSPGLVWSPELKRFIFFCGSITHHFTGERPYDVMSLDPAEGKWKNDLPKGAEDRGGETGNVKDVNFKSPYFEMADTGGLVRPNRRHTYMWYHYAAPPWEGKVYALICGHTLCYDPKERTWKDTKAAAGPMPEVGGRGGLSWSAMCADPVNKEILLFGGCGVLTPDGSPGTWVYAVEKNEWRKLDLKTEPPPRALAPMVYDPATKKIVLFGGDRLDQLYADTWVYDCASRTWEEKKPALSPSPRFGHALLRLPKSGKIVLLGGKGYSSSTDYCAT